MSSSYINLSTNWVQMKVIGDNCNPPKIMVHTKIQENTTQANFPTNETSTKVARPERGRLQRMDD